MKITFIITLLTFFYTVNGQSKKVLIQTINKLKEDSISNNELIIKNKNLLILKEKELNQISSEFDEKVRIIEKKNQKLNELGNKIIEVERKIIDLNSQIKFTKQKDSLNKIDLLNRNLTIDSLSKIIESFNTPSSGKSDVLYYNDISKKKINLNYLQISETNDRYSRINFNIPYSMINQKGISCCFVKEHLIKSIEFLDENVATILLNNNKKATFLYKVSQNIKESHNHNYYANDYNSCSIANENDFNITKNDNFYSIEFTNSNQNKIILYFSKNYQYYTASYFLDYDYRTFFKSILNDCSQTFERLSFNYKNNLFSNKNFFLVGSISFY
ncbi:MAG: hypothetical protein VX756_03585 [Bacteroidota bacterium]|nr:hypothetical protein [Bacteroidota bacterium]